LYRTAEGRNKTHFQFPVISNNNMEHDWTCEAIAKPAVPTVKYWNGKSDVWLTAHRDSVWIRKTN
jgi:hypothetical protein